MKRIKVCATAIAFVYCLMPTMLGGSMRADVPTQRPSFSNPLNITNRFMPFQPGGTKVFQGESKGAKEVVVDLYFNETRTFRFNGADVATRILREIAFDDGKLVEIADNYFAQADDGTVYYFGEVVDNYEDGRIANHDGSWLVGGPTRPTDPPDTGVESDPTVFMPANPEVGDVFKPEDLFPIVDETAEVQKVDVSVNVPAGKYKDAIKIKESTALSSATENKWYAPGVGVVKASGKGSILELISSTLTAP